MATDPSDRALDTTNSVPDAARTAHHRAPFRRLAGMRHGQAAVDGGGTGGGGRRLAARARCGRDRRRSRPAGSISPEWSRPAIVWPTARASGWSNGASRCTTRFPSSGWTTYRNQAHLRSAVRRTASPMCELGSAALSLLLDHLSGGPMLARRGFELACRLVERQSTAPAHEHGLDLQASGAKRGWRPAKKNTIGSPSRADIRNTRPSSIS